MIVLSIDLRIKNDSEGIVEWYKFDYLTSNVTKTSKMILALIIVWQVPHRRMYYRVVKMSSGR